MHTAERQAGMTLLEILVVLVITAILSTMLVLRFASRTEGELQHESERLAILLQQHCQDALLLGQVRGLSLSPRGYKFWYLSNRQWLDASNGNRLYRAREWVSDWDLDLRLNGQPVSLNQDQEIPQIVCQTDAQLPIFELRLSSQIRSTGTFYLSRGDAGRVAIGSSS